MSLSKSLPRLALPRFALRPRPLSTSTARLTQAGYGDPTSERIENETPLPKGKDNGPNARSGHATESTTPDSSESGGSVGNAGGKEGSTSGGVSEKDIRETKKIGEDPKKEEVGGAGVIGG